MTEPTDTITRAQFVTIVNESVDQVLQHAGGDRGWNEDLANILVNVIVHRFDEPTATLPEAIEQSWDDESVDTVLGWIS